MGPSGQNRRSGDVIGFYQQSGFSDEFANLAHFPLSHNQRQGRYHHFFAGGGQAFNHISQKRRAKGGALRTHHFTHTNRVDVGFIGHAEVKIAPILGRPIEQHRPQGEFRGCLWHRITSRPYRRPPRFCAGPRLRCQDQGVAPACRQPRHQPRAGSRTQPAPHRRGPADGLRFSER